jgi:hypothetical protein
MSTPLWVNYKNDPCYGDTDPDGNVDDFNRANKGIWGNLTSYTGVESFGAGTGEHDRTGNHKVDLSASLAVIEEGTYQGNGADNRNISLSDSSLTIDLIRVWDGAVAYTFFRSSDMAGDNTKGTGGTAFVADYIQSIATTGQFQVGTTLNVNLRDYYYIAYGL